MNLRPLLLVVFALSACGSDHPSLYQGYAEGEYVLVAAPDAGILEDLAVRRGEEVAQGARLFALEQRNEAAGRQQAEAQLQLAQRLAGQGRRDDAEKWLRQAASGGHADAMAALGLHLLNRPPPAPPGLIDEARRFLMMAGERGHADAAHLVSLMLAITPSVPRNWTRALDFLGHAAGAGHAGAQAQLQFLSAESVDGGWQAMRQALNLAALLKVPPLRRICASPFIAVAEGFLDARTCDWIKDRGGIALDIGSVVDYWCGFATRSLHFIQRYAELESAAPPLAAPAIAMARPNVVVLTPVKDARATLPAFVDALTALEHPADRLSVCFLEGDSTDGSRSWLKQRLPDLADVTMRAADLVRREITHHLARQLRWSQAPAGAAGATARHHHEIGRLDESGRQERCEGELGGTQSEH